MITEHALSKSLCRRGQPLRVLIVGAGGNGSAVLLGLPYLHQAMKVWGHAGGLHVMLVDGDQVTETNCVRQPFASADVGLNKATVLINRVNLFWGLRWQAHPEHFHKDSLRTNSAGPHLIIGCVDTRAARQAILSAVTLANDSTVYWLDLGNNASSGQYVLGHLPQHRGQVVLHWFTGSKSEARRAIELGCYFSINAQMLKNDRGREIVSLLPKDRLLTETDGPFTQVDGRPATPRDVNIAIEGLANALGNSSQQTVRLIRENLKQLLQSH